MGRILVFGKEGQLASSLQRKTPSSDILFRGSTDVNFLEPEEVAKAIEYERPSLIINCSAYTKVDKAEFEKEMAYKINVESVQAIAIAAKKMNSRLIHLSTDYVFDGEKIGPYGETDPKNPLNVYGETKSLGEDAILKEDVEALILRTSWVVSEYGHNFVKTMLTLGSERETLKVVCDQWGSPTFADDLAKTIWKLVEIDGWKSPGVYHVTNEGFCSWFELAEEIFKIAGSNSNYKKKVQQLLPVRTQEFGSPVRRPANSCLSKDKLHREFGLKLRPWREGLIDCVHRILKF